MSILAHCHPAILLEAKSRDHHSLDGFYPSARLCLQHISPEQWLCDSHCPWCRGLPAPDPQFQRQSWSCCRSGGGDLGRKLGAMERTHILRPLGQPTQPPPMLPHFHAVNNSLINRAVLTTLRQKSWANPQARRDWALTQQHARQAAGFSSRASCWLGLKLYKPIAPTSQEIRSDTNRDFVWFKVLHPLITLLTSILGQQRQWVSSPY